MGKIIETKDQLHVGQRVTSIPCREVMAMHVTEQGEVLVCLKEAVRMYMLEGNLLHEWKTNIYEPTGLASKNIEGTDYIMVSQIIAKNETGDLEAAGGAQPVLNDTIEIQIKDKTDRQPEAIPWGIVAYSVPGECGLGSNLILLKSGHLALAVKESDEVPCKIHVLKCSTTVFECVRQIKTESIHPPSICGLRLGTRDIIVVADCWNANEESSILIYEEETGDAVLEINEQKLKEVTKKKDFLLSSVCSTNYNRLLISEGPTNLIFEIAAKEELHPRELFNAWDHNIWHPSKMAWHAKSHSLVICHKYDNRLNSITDGECSLSIYTMY